MQIISIFRLFLIRIAAIGLTFLLPVILSLTSAVKIGSIDYNCCYTYAVVLLGQEFAVFGWRLSSFGDG